MPDDLFDSFLETIKEYSMVAPGEKVLIAVSGGADSMALLHLFHRWIPNQIGVFHLNHGFRPSAPLEAEAVNSYGQKLGLPCHVFSYNVSEYLRESGQSKQQGARKIRYKLMEECAERHGYSRIALGHHADDQAETVLMRIIRGSGIKGLAGIPPVRGVFIRPLICVFKDKLEGYCSEHEIPVQTDESNLDSVYFRNKVRHKLLPLLEGEYNPQVKRNLITLASLAQDDERELDTIARKIVAKHSFRQNAQVGLDRPYLSGQSPSLQRRILRNLIALYKGNLLQVEYGHIETIRKKIGDGSVFEYQLPQVLVIGTANTVLLGRYSAPVWEKGTLNVPGEFDGGLFRFRAELFAAATLPPRPENAEDFAYESLNLPLSVRPRRPGDRIVPFGHKTARKVKDLMIDAKIPVQIRSHYPMLCDQSDLLWLPNVKRSSKGCLTGSENKVIRVTIEPSYCHGKPPVL